MMDGMKRAMGELEEVGSCSDFIKVVKQAQDIEEVCLLQYIYVGKINYTKNLKAICTAEEKTLCGQAEVLTSFFTKMVG